MLGWSSRSASGLDKHIALVHEVRRLQGRDGERTSPMRDSLVCVPSCLLAFPATIRDGLTSGAPKLGGRFETRIAMSATRLSKRERRRKYTVYRDAHGGREIWARMNCGYYEAEADPNAARACLASHIDKSSKSPTRNHHSRGLSGRSEGRF